MKAPSSRPRTLRKASFRMTIAVVLLMLTACAAQKPFRFVPKSVSQISYDPSSCTQMPDGKFRCRDVIFTVTAVQVPPASETNGSVTASSSK
jgi:hypothetical protein